MCAYPVEVSGKVAKNGTWGGTRFYGCNNGSIAINYCFLSNNSGNTGEGEKIRYNVTSSLQDFKIIVKDDVVSLYIDNNHINTVSATATETVMLSGGSNANPVTVSNVKVKKI